jgi:hypothetical protein
MIINEALKKHIIGDSMEISNPSLTLEGIFACILLQIHPSIST